MKKVLFVLLVFIVHLYSCKDDRINEVIEFKSMNGFYDENKPVEQIFLITSDSINSSLVGVYGTELNGFRDILQYPNGDSIPIPYEIRLIELYSYKDMILYKMPSISDDCLLESCGKIKITAWHNDTELELRIREKYPLILSSSPTKQGMHIFQGQHPNDKYGNWILSSDGSFINATTKYNLFTGKMGWQNCAQKRENIVTADISIKVEGTGVEYIDLFLLTDHYYSVLIGGNLSIKSAPIGQKASLIAMAKDQNNRYRLHKSIITVSEGLEVKLDMNIVTEAELLSILSRL